MSKHPDRPEARAAASPECDARRASDWLSKVDLSSAGADDIEGHSPKKLSPTARLPGSEGRVH
jgi:hypothetical protein